jgi:hypothetical protein
VLAVIYYMVVDLKYCRCCQDTSFNGQRGHGFVVGGVAIKTNTRAGRRTDRQKISLFCWTFL